MLSNSFLVFPRNYQKNVVCVGDDFIPYCCNRRNNLLKIFSTARSQCTITVTTNLCRTSGPLPETRLVMSLYMKDMSLLCTDKFFLIRDKIILSMSGPTTGDRKHFCRLFKLRMYKDFLVYLSWYGREVPLLQFLWIYFRWNQIVIAGIF